MARFVPKDKLSKKAQKELNRQRRTMWEFSPVTKTVDSKKLYNRKKNTRDRYDEYGASVFQLHYFIIKSFVILIMVPVFIAAPARIIPFRILGW